jgi:hypothetical protein
VRRSPGSQKRRSRRPKAGCGYLVALLALTLAASASAHDLHVQGNRLFDGSQPVVLHGVNRSGLEYACIQGWGFFDGPHPEQIDGPAMIAAMKSWNIDIVRVPLNEDCWLGVNAPAGHSGALYRRIVRRYVAALERAGLDVIIDLHWAAPGRSKATGIDRMPDADHAPAFWRSVGASFKNDHRLLFDLYNEPHDVGWDCWLHGCQIPALSGQPAYQAAGMQQLIGAVRSSGARQPLMLGGIDWALDVRGWLAHMPLDPLHQLVAAEHDYGGLSPCDAGCRAALVRTADKAPVILGELGETDCRHGYIDQMMPFADAHAIGYLGWTWDAVVPGGWSCTGGPSLITDYKGSPTGFGIGLRDHLKARGRLLR